MDPSVLLAFPLLLALSTPCNACHCKLEHPQTYYCMSDIVILVDILGPGNNTLRKRSFKVNTIKILKAPKGVTEIHNIYTPLHEEKDCGYQRTDADESRLLIAGYLRSGKVLFTKCHLVYSWNLLSSEHKMGFETAYKKGCECQVLPCRLCSIGCPEADVTDCVWAQDSCKYTVWRGIHSVSSMCVPSSSGRCEWTHVQ